MSDAKDALLKTMLQRWDAYPDDLRAELETLIDTGLAAAAEAKPELITVMNPTSRPQRLQLAAIVSEQETDAMYHLEWSQLEVSTTGRLFLAYRRRDGGDYAIEWSPATTLPPALQNALGDALTLALLSSDR